LLGGTPRCPAPASIPPAGDRPGLCCPVPAPEPSRREETLLKIFFSRPICRELVDWLPIYPIRPPLPSIGCSITLNWPD
jgi:hypothetical protein